MGALGEVDQAGQLCASAIENGFYRQFFFWPERIVGVMAVREGGPCLLIFDAGARVEITGDAEAWRREIAIAQLLSAAKQQKESTCAGT